MGCHHRQQLDQAEVVTLEENPSKNNNDGCERKTSEWKTDHLNSVHLINGQIQIQWGAQSDFGW